MFSHKLKILWVNTHHLISLSLIVPIKLSGSMGFHLLTIYRRKAQLFDTCYLMKYQMSSANLCKFTKTYNRQKHHIKPQTHTKKQSKVTRQQWGSNDATLRFTIAVSRRAFDELILQNLFHYMVINFRVESIKYEWANRLAIVK